MGLIGAAGLARTGRGRGVEPVVGQEGPEAAEVRADLRPDAAGGAPLGGWGQERGEAGDALRAEGAMHVEADAVGLVDQAPVAGDALVLARREEDARAEGGEDGFGSIVEQELLPADATLDA